MTLALPQLLFCMLMAFLMGFAIQHGATCVVAAVQEALVKRRFNRLISFLEAALWVLGGLLILGIVFGMRFSPIGYDLTSLTLIGGGIMGFGAYVNRACMFGTLARLGGGELAYLGSFVGYFAVAWLVRVLDPSGALKPHLVRQSLIIDMKEVGDWVALVALVILSLRLTQGWWKLGWSRDLGDIWTGLRNPRLATILIGISFVPLYLVAGPWAYTSVFDEIADGRIMHVATRVILLVALFAGCLVGYFKRETRRAISFRWRQFLFCLAGGGLMATGAYLVPGSNDSIILLGLPFLQPYALGGFAAMCLTVAGALWTEKRFARMT
jgi:toxin CptA